MLFTYSLMGWEASEKMGTSSSVGHAWLRKCGLAAVARGVLLSGCVWEYQEPGVKGEGGLPQLPLIAFFGNTIPQEMGGVLWWVPQAPKVDSGSGPSLLPFG